MKILKKRCVIASMAILFMTMSVVLGKTNPQIDSASQQVNELVGFVIDIIGTQNKDKDTKDTPLTDQVLDLHQKLLIQVVRDVLTKNITSTLSQDKMDELKKGLTEFTKEQLNSSIGGSLREGNETQMETVLSLWNNEGRELTRLSYRWSLQYMISVFLDSSLSESDKVRLKEQIDILSTTIESEVLKSYPMIPRQSLSTASIDIKTQAISTMNAPYLPGVKIALPDEQIKSIVTDIARADKQFVPARTKRFKRFGVQRVDIESILSDFWYPILAKMAVPQSPELNQEINAVQEKLLQYQYKINNPQDRLAENYIASDFIIRQRFQEREDFAWLVRLGMELFPDTSKP